MRDLVALAAFFAERRSLPFAWGANDCVSFAAGAVLALTGNDPLAGIESWTDEKSAVRALAAAGGLLAAVSSVLTEIPVAQALRGDVGAVDTPAGPLLMVIEGVLLVGPDMQGTSFLPRSRLMKAWSAAR